MGFKDADVTVLELRARVREFVEARGWTPYHHPKELAVSISVEAAELLEVFQWEEKAPLEAIKADGEALARIRDESADVAIYLLSLCNQLDIDLSDAVFAKLERNEGRYPVDDVLRTGRYRKDRTRSGRCPSRDPARLSLSDRRPESPLRRRSGAKGP